MNAIETTRLAVEKSAQAARKTHDEISQFLVYHRAELATLAAQPWTTPKLIVELSEKSDKLSLWERNAASYAAWVSDSPAFPEPAQESPEAWRAWSLFVGFHAGAVGQRLLNVLRDLENFQASGDSFARAHDAWDEEQAHRAVLAQNPGCVSYVFGVDFDSEGGALTLATCEVTDSPHADGWTVTGEIHEDYLEWVNEFEAVHTTLGRVWGNFEEIVYASSKEAFDNFMVNHAPEAWDYQDI